MRYGGFLGLFLGVVPLDVGSARINLIMYILWAVLLSGGVGLPLAWVLALLVGSATRVLTAGFDGMLRRPDLGGCSSC